MAQVIGLLHSSLLVTDLRRSRPFYEDVLGLTPSSLRPPMSFDGVWYELGDQQIHLLELPNPEAALAKPAHGGRDRHVAVRVDDLEGMREKLEAAGIAYTRSQSGRSAIFCRDPDGNAFELIS
jgi:catechol 2,3-dioxygenase-like lactoylglutathione lyase family enzyme